MNKQSSIISVVIACLLFTACQDDETILELPNSYTKVDQFGNLVNDNTPVGDWECVYDSDTNLYWEVKTLSNHDTQYNWSDATGVHADTIINTGAGLCGYNTGWRLPSLDELNGLVYQVDSSNEAIDDRYFPYTEAGHYWTNEEFSASDTAAWVVNFTSGYFVPVHKQKNVGTYVRLVHDI